MKRHASRLGLASLLALLLTASLLAASLLAGGCVTAYAGVTDYDEGSGTDSATTVVNHVIRIGGAEVTSPDLESMEATRDWVAENGGDPDSLRLVNSHTTFTGVTVGEGGVILVGDPDELDGGPATYHYRQDDYYEADAAGEQPPILPAFADEQTVTVGRGDFEPPHYVALGEDDSITPVTGTVTEYRIGGEVYDSYDALRTFLASQSAGAVIFCDFAFVGSGDWADFSDSGMLTFTMAAAVNNLSITMDAPAADSPLPTAATVSGTADGMAVSPDNLPVDSIVWSPDDKTAAADTLYTARITLHADRGAVLADLVAATVNGDAAGCVRDGESVIVTYTFPMTRPAVSERIKEVTVTLAAPVIGTDIESSAPDAAVPDGAHYAVDAADWIKGTYIEAGDDFEAPVTGVFAADTWYYAEIALSADSGYGFDSDLTILVNGQPPAEVFPVYGGTNTFFIAKIKAAEAKAEVPVYTFLDGQNGVWNGKGELSFRADGDYGKFTGVKVDGAAIEESSYTAASGSTVVTLKEAYLNTLADGEHTLTVVYTDGEASTVFTVARPAAPAASGASPQTGDGAAPALWLGLMAASLMGTVGLMWSRRKQHAAR